MRLLVFILALAATPLALASPQLSGPDANGFTWATIGAPGNPHAPQVGGLWNPDPPRGAVNYEYRMSQTELTVAQWFEFVNAYSPFAEFPNDTTFTGGHIGSNFDGTYFIFGDDEIVQHWPASMAPRYAARFVNWLHNDKVNEQWAFESGVYDTSTFGNTEIGGATAYTDDYTPAAGAKYWIPSLDEWVKGMYYDPDRFGEGEGGYWAYPHSSDVLPVTGLPDEGGETNAGFPASGPAYMLSVGSYPEVQSPWGLLDGSGGAAEFLITESDLGKVGVKGTSAYTIPEFMSEFEFYEYMFFSAPTSTSFTLRLASAVPPPGTWFVWVVLGTLHLRRQR